MQPPSTRYLGSCGREQKAEENMCAKIDLTETENKGIRVLAVAGMVFMLVNMILC